jgi:hypothetical protein
MMECKSCPFKILVEKKRKLQKLWARRKRKEKKPDLALRY